MKLVRKNITKRRRLVYRHRRRRIIRGGNIDDDANELINRLNTYDHNSIADLLETLNGNTDFKAEVIKYNLRFNDNIKRSTCHYMETFDRFVNETLITAIETLRRPTTPHETTPTSNEDDETKPPKLTLDIVNQLCQGKDLNALNGLIGALLDKYLSAQDNPCLLMKGTSATLHARPQQQQQRLTKYPLRGSLLEQQRLRSLQAPGGGSRRKNNRRNRRTRRTRRTQRGGELVLTLIVVGFSALLLVIAATMAFLYDKS